MYKYLIIFYHERLKKIFTLFIEYKQYKIHLRENFPFDVFFHLDHLRNE